MNLIHKYFVAFKQFGENTAFCSGEDCIRYKDFFQLVNDKRALIEGQADFATQTAIGVFCDEQKETYASIFAIWFSGCYFVPIQKNAPSNFISNIIRKHNIKIVFSNEDVDPKLEVLNISNLKNKEQKERDYKIPFEWREHHILYVLHTSGSTGTPKNVPINLGNIEAFVDGFLDLYPELNASDNFLQTYELTADAAFTGYLIPLLIGATVFTVEDSPFKPFGVAKILNEKPITWIQVTPSLLLCLQAYFDSFHLPNLKHFHFGGEALPLQLVEEWRSHVPNAEISNVYGPTETTVTASIYKCLPKQTLIAKNNTISIGKPLKTIDFYIKTKNNEKEGAGELYIGGKQVMGKYMFTNSQAFKLLKKDGNTQKFYPTADLVEKDLNGNYYFLGRIDEQVKINGFRVDLIEIENTVRKVLNGSQNVAAAAVEFSPGLKKLIVFIENFQGPEADVITKLSGNLPPFKVPEKIISVPTFPLSTSGKTDKKKLISTYFTPNK